jgi:hypothetical protein
VNLGESPEQRAEMAFQLSAIDPTSVPITLLNPRRGTKFGDRDFRPDNRSGWLAGETPDVVDEFLDGPAGADGPGIEIRLWNPAEQLRFTRNDAVPPRPDGGANAWRETAA